MKKCLALLALTHALPSVVPAAEPAPAAAPAPPTAPSAAELALDVLVDRQDTLLAGAAKGGDNFDEDNFRTAMQDLANDYEAMLKKYPDYAPAYAAYGLMLSKISMSRQSAMVMLKANEIFSRDAKNGGPRTPSTLRTWAMVKNQLGNYVAEDGQPLVAVNYYLAAIELMPNEPLYHYQLGKLLTEARDDFLKAGPWTPATLGKEMHQAFQRAAELAPDRLEFTYRYAESFYDLDPPDWDGALKAWASLEDKATTSVERQTMRLHAANILIKQQKFDPARLLLASVTEQVLQEQKQKLVAQLPANAEK
jgi:tetratricopeptide (TPR) repeat protein